MSDHPDTSTTCLSDEYALDWSPPMTPQTTPEACSSSFREELAAGTACLGCNCGRAPMTTPEAELREKIAREIDPTAWAMTDRREQAWRETATYFRALDRTEATLRKADAILRLQATAEPRGGERDGLLAIVGLIADMPDRATLDSLMTTLEQIHEVAADALASSPPLLESGRGGEEAAWQRRAENMELALSRLARAARRVLDAREAWASPDRDSHPNLVLEEAEAWIGLQAAFDPASDALSAAPSPQSREEGLVGSSPEGDTPSRDAAPDREPSGGAE